MGLTELMNPTTIDWEKESYPVYQDFLALPFFALFFPSKLGRRLILGAEFQKIDIEKDDDRRKKVYKFKESAWKLIYYLSAELLALVVAHDEPWFMNTLKLKLKGLYMYTGGFYAYSIFALMFWEARAFARVGSVVLALHDGSDVFLEVAKMSKYGGFHSSFGSLSHAHNTHSVPQP
ncbi:hypothetical protein MKX01_033644 [Papaver californicum]|nr:hypothetical protein MKX01_033644 [Papaver californicum]